MRPICFMSLIKICLSKGADIFKYTLLKEMFFIQISLTYTLKKASIDLGKGLVLNRQQAIAWSNAKPTPWRHMTSPGLNEVHVHVYVFNI